MMALIIPTGSALIARSEDKSTVQALFLIQASSSQAQITTPASQQEVVAWLQHQESFVRSMECTFENVESPTSPENIPRIHEVCDKHGMDAEQYVYTKELTDKWTCSVGWYREGSKERWDKFRKAEGQSAHLAKDPFRVMAFDGHVARELERGADQIIGSLMTFEDSHFRAAVPDPFSFLFEYAMIPYSEILAGGTDLRISTVSREGQVFTQVSVRYEPEKKSFVLLFDNNHRLVERQLIAHSKSVSGIIEKHTFSDYVRHTDDSGESVWFPHQAVWHHYIGPLPEDPPVEYGKKTLTIKQIKFNVDIPDEKFTIQFPPGTKIYDEISGFGWVSKDEEEKFLKKFVETFPDAEVMSKRKPSVQVDTKTSESAEKLRKLNTAILMYADDHDDKYPDDILALYSYLDAEDLNWLLIHITYLAKGKTSDDQPTILLAYDRTPAEDKPTNVLFNNNRVELVTAERLKKLGISRAEIQIETRYVMVSETFIEEIGFDANSIYNANAWPEFTI